MEAQFGPPHCNGLNDELENVQKRSARFVPINYSYETGSTCMTGILEELKWETLQKRRKYNRLILLYKGLKGKTRIPTDDLIPKNRRYINQHSLRRLSAIMFYLHFWNFLSVIYRWNRNEMFYLLSSSDVAYLDCVDIYKAFNFAASPIIECNNVLSPF